MKKRLWALALGLCLMALGVLTAPVAWAKDYDEVVSYRITAAPNVDDGSILFTADFDWKALEKLPYGQELKIGVPNGSIREVQKLTDNIERLDFDNSYMYVYLTDAYSAGTTFHFAYAWVQEYMYTLDESGAVGYDYTPGWFDEAVVDHMELTWQDPAGLTSQGSYTADDGDRWTVNGMTLVGENLPHGSRINLRMTYPQWPTDLSWDNSSENLPPPYSGDGGYEDDGDDAIIGLIAFIIVVVIVLVIISAARRDGYAGGFGTHYVFVNGLWYPSGHDGKPKPGSTGTVNKPKPPAASHSGGFGGGRRGGGFGGGGRRGGGFGGGGFGGGSHCACASSCACACACACAGGGRAGCSAKNLYGAVHLDETLTRHLGE